MDRTHGGSLVWNTPVEGLRFGYTTNYVTDIDVETHVASVEYTHDKWVFAAEYHEMKKDSVSNIMASPPIRVVNAPVAVSEEHWYVQATYQATDKLGLGAYYAQSDYDPENKNVCDDKFTTI